MKQRRWFIFAIVALGVFLRTYQFPDNPPGLYVDEAYAGYDAFSILHTGMDQWGVRLPVYFISSSAGQSVMYSYLTIPFVWVFGLSRFSIRLLSLFVGILTLPLLYVAVKQLVGQPAAILSTLLLSIMPWHVMISRWALDANLLPFFLLLSVYTLGRALASPSSGLALMSLLILGSSLYAYAMAFVVVPMMLLLFFLFYRKAILAKWHDWLGASILFACLATPVALLLAKNFIFHNAIDVEKILPFGIPLLPVDRLAQLSTPFPQRIDRIFSFVTTGFQDGEIRNSVIGVPSIFLILFPLTIIGLVFLHKKYRQSKLANPFLLWLVASVPVFFLVEIAIHRVNAIYIPLIVVAVCGALALRERLPAKHATRRIFDFGIASLVALQSIVFAIDYYFVYPTLPDSEIAFFKGFDRALSKGVAIAAPNDPMLVTARIAQPQMLTAMYLNYPPEKYQREVTSPPNDPIHIHAIGRYYFGADSLPDADAPFTFVLGKWDADPCDNPTIALETRLWKVGKCN